MKSQTETSQAFLLRSVDHGESNRILTLFTRDLGKISGLARSAKTSRRRFGGTLEPFTLMEITVKRGNRNLYHLEKAYLLEAYSELTGDLDKVNAAATILEIVREVTPERQPETEIFALLKCVLSRLATSPPRAANSILIFAALNILLLSGLSGTVDRCSACGRLVPEGRKVRFNPARGGVVCSPCGGGPLILGEGAARALRIFAEADLDRAVAFSLGQDVTTELQQAVKEHIEYHLERPLRTPGLKS